MANIGSFHRVGDELHGEIITLSLQTKDARLVPVATTQGRTVQFKLFVGRAEVGQATARGGIDHYEVWDVILDDPSFTTPILATLVPDGNGNSLNLIWTRV